MNDLENQTMTELTTDESTHIDGGFSWCGAFFVGGAAAFAGGLTGGSGILVGAEAGAMAAELFCN